MRAMMATRAGRTRLEFRLGGTGPAPHRLARVCAKVCVCVCAPSRGSGGESVVGSGSQVHPGLCRRSPSTEDGLRLTAFVGWRLCVNTIVRFCFSLAASLSSALAASYAWRNSAQLFVTFV